MGLIYLFRRLVFAQVLLGIVSFCMAEPNPEILLVAGALVALSWYVAEGPTGKPLPQWAILLGAMVAVGLLVVEMIRLAPEDSNGLVKAVGHLTLWLQVIQLYGRKTNRDYALLLVLSLLQMVGASVLSVSVVFGLLLLAYCVLSLFTVLMFQIKSTSDAVMQATERLAPPQVRVRRPAPVVGRGHRAQFRLAGVAIGVGCASVAVLVFVLLPREMLFPPAAGNSVATQAPREVGFTKQVQLGVAGPKGGGREPVLHLTVTQHGQNIGSSARPWLLRGATMDSYDPSRRQWVRSHAMGWSDLPIDLGGKVWRELAVGWSEPAGGAIESSVTLRSLQSRTLFTLAPLLGLELTASGNIRSIQFNPDDQQVTLAENVSPGGLTYRMRSAVVPDQAIQQAYRQLISASSGKTPSQPSATASASPVSAQAGYARGWSSSSRTIGSLAEQVIRQAGLERHLQEEPQPSDLAIIQALAAYLKTHCSYTLNAAAAPPREDPIAYFLLRSRQGHCELFASAAAAMGRSLGLRIRLVSGYLASDYNRIGGYYAVREKDAHAWIEVDLGPQGWVSFDPTPAGDSAGQSSQPQRSWVTWTKQLYEYLEYTWLQNVVAYDANRRQAMFQSIRQTLGPESGDADESQTRRRQLEQWARAWWVWAKKAPWQAGLVSIACGLGLLALAGLMRWVVGHRRRLAWLQLSRLPRSERRQMARQLGFYLSMVQMLDRVGCRKARWQTPLAFAQQLNLAHRQAFEPVLGLTEFFYQVRFGHQPLTGEQQQRVDRHLADLMDRLDRFGSGIGGKTARAVDQ